MKSKEKKYQVGDTVYLITDNDQQQRFVTGVIERKHCYMYELSCGTETSEHYDFEISETKSYNN